MRLKWILAIAALSVGQILIGCGSSTDAKTDDTAKSDATKTDNGKKPDPAKPDLSKSEEVKPATTTNAKKDDGDATKGFSDDEKTNRGKLTIEDTTVGTGQMLQKGDFALMEYKGSLTNGTVFDSNTAGSAHPQPFGFFVGQGQVIKGWEYGMPGLRVGGTRKLTIPSDLGYGTQGGGDKIPPNSTLVFTVKLLDVVKSGEEQMYDSKTITPGTGDASVKKGDKITVEYTATLTNGSKIDSTADRGKPYTFTVGKGEVIAGFDAGVEGMKVGEKRHLRLPPLLAYGMMESGADPAASKLSKQTLLYDVELKKIEAGSGAAPKN